MNAEAAASRTGRARAFTRAITRRCPRCGSRHLFRAYLVMVEDCPRCGLHFEREPGYWVGAMAVDFIMVGVLFLSSFGVTLALTLPDFNVAVILGVLVPIVVLGPILLYPTARTLWVAVDRELLHRLDPHENVDE